MDSTNGNIETLTLSLDIDYSGNFQLSVDTKMKFGKTAFLSIKGLFDFKIYGNFLAQQKNFIIAKLRHIYHRKFLKIEKKKHNSNFRIESFLSLFNHLSITIFYKIVKIVFFPNFTNFLFENESF